MPDRDLIEALRQADPVRYAGGEATLDAPAPRDVLARIVAEPPPRPIWRRREGAAVLVAAVAAIATVIILVTGGHAGPNLAERAYAATSPDDVVYYTETTIETHGGGAPRQLDIAKTWQYRDRSRQMTVGYEHGRRFVYERHGKYATSALDVYRREFARNRLRDAGPTRFAGRPARAYVVLGQPAGQTQTFYLDPETALPLGQVFKGKGGLTITATIKRFARLAPTPANLAKLLPDR
jgi:hypothetical protein